MSNFHILLLWILVVFVHISLQSISISDAIDTVGGKMHLTSKYCDEKTEKKYSFNVSNNGIEVVNPDTFVNCNQVNNINLSKNKIQELDENTFENNENLKHLYLQCNRLVFIPNELLAPLKLLKVLDVSGNPLGTMEPILNSNLISLTHLDLTNIELTEVNENQIKAKIPSLKTVYLGYNFISCKSFENSKTGFLAKLTCDCCDESRVKKCLDVDDWMINDFNQFQHKLQVDFEKKINEIKNLKNEENTVLKTFLQDSGTIWRTLVVLMICYIIALVVLLNKTCMQGFHH